MSSSVSLPTQLPSESQNSMSVARATQPGDIVNKTGPASRRDWITGEFVSLLCILDPNNIYCRVASQQSWATYSVLCKGCLQAGGQ